MGQLCHAAHAYLLVDSNPAGLLDYLQRLTTALPGENLVAIACALLKPTTRTLTIALAGLPPPLLRAADGSCSYLLIDPMPLLGTPFTYPAQPMQPAVMPMRPNDCLLLFTDGLVEHRHKELDEQLDTLLSEAARLHAPRPDLPGLVRALQPTPADDITLLAINGID